MSIKKVLISFSCVCFLIVNYAFAGIISYSALSNDSGVNYSYLNTSFSTVYNEVNGNLSSVNMLADGLTESNFADAINPRVRDDELIGDMTYSGMLPVTSANLTSNISAGTSYVSGYRVVTNATSKTYTALKDTYVYIDQNGAFQYVEVANGATAPTSPANSLLLAKVVTDTDNITSVTDLRQTTPLNLRIYQDLKSGLVISRDPTTATIVTIGRGEIELGTTNKVRRNISQISVDLSTTGIGGLDTGSLALGYYYIFAIPDPDNTTHFKGIASLNAADASGVTGERLVGWCYADSGSVISPLSLGAYRIVGGDAPNIYSYGQANMGSAVNQDTTATVKSATFYSSGRPIEIKYWVTSKSAASATELEASVSIDNAIIPETEVTANVDNTYPDTASGVYTTTLGQGTHTIILKMTTANQAQTLQGYRLVIEEK